MTGARVRKKTKKGASAQLSFFKVLYLSINFFVYIGYFTKTIVSWPFVKLGSLLFSILKFLREGLNKINLKGFVSKKRGRGRPRKSLLARSKEYFLIQRKKIKKLHFSFPHITSATSLLHRLHFKLPSFTFVTNKISYIFLGSFLTLIALFVYQSYIFTKNLPSPYTIGKVNYPLSTHIYDRKGKLLYEVYREQNRTPVDLDKIPSYVPQATIAIEDKDFYRHKGISFVSGILRASKEILVNKNLQGGSTITQQLVKSALLSPERTIQRKIKEIILALWTEQIYNKKQILEMYLNQVAYGGSAYGIQEGARTYFGKDAKDLKLEEAALLAGLPQAPSLYSPYVNPDLAIIRRNEVLQNMYEQGYIDKKTEEKALRTKLSIVPLKTQIHAPHFVFYVKSELEKQYGIRQVEEGGFKVTTTLDLEIQNEAEKILKEELQKVSYLNVTNGAILVTKPSTGEILAMVGSVDYFANSSGAFNVTTALRQPGSSIKPVMYSLALEKGYTAATLIDDSPTVFNIPGAETYRPVNYDGRFHGKVPLRLALANSYNIPAVKVLSTVGVNDFAEHARQMGISSWNDPSRLGLSMTLGGIEVTMLDMATAFGVFANSGYRVDLNYINKLEDTKGENLINLSPTRTKVLDEGVAYIISDILSDNAARISAFGPGSALEIPGWKVAVKTGTTDDKKDNWTNGYTPEYEVVVWVGNNNNTPMNPALASGITGAAPIWNRVMTYLLTHDGHKEMWLKKPENIVERNCYYNKQEVFIAGTENSVSCKDGMANSPTRPPRP